MSDHITIAGLVAAQPRHIVTSAGLPITSFRLAPTQRRFDTSAEKWIDGETNWYTVAAFRQLATHTAESVNKGDRILVVGKLRIREWENDERTGTNIEMRPKKWSSRLQWASRSASTKCPPTERSGDHQKLTEPRERKDNMTRRPQPSDRVRKLADIHSTTIVWFTVTRVAFNSNGDYRNGLALEYGHKVDGNLCFHSATAALNDQRHDAHGHVTGYDEVEASL